MQIRASLLILGIVFSGCASVSVELADHCAIVSHSFWNITYFRTVKCMSKDVYNALHELPIETLIDEMREEPED